LSGLLLLVLLLVVLLLLLQGMHCTALHAS
jgi:hypothetical protein